MIINVDFCCLNTPSRNSQITIHRVKKTRNINTIKCPLALPTITPDHAHPGYEGQEEEVESGRIPESEELEMSR